MSVELFPLFGLSDDVPFPGLLGVSDDVPFPGLFVVSDESPFPELPGLSDDVPFPGLLFCSQMHDEIFVDKSKTVYRQTNNAGGIEGGMTNGEAVVIKGTMKPIPTMRKSLATVDLKDMSPTNAHF